MRKNQQGQSIIEVIVSLAIIVLVILALVGVTTVAVRNARFAKNQALATQYAQEAIEDVRASRDQDSTAFFAGGCPASEQDIDIFNRKVECEYLADRVKVTVTVTWAGSSHETKLVTYFTEWD